MVALTIHGSEETLAVGKIVCLLKSYRAHAKEMKSAPSMKPEFFLKPSTAIIHDGMAIILPKESKEVHHEVELAIVIGKRGKDIPSSQALDHILGYAVFIDVTARDLQLKAMADGRPWAIAKGYDTFAPISAVMPKAQVVNPQNLELWLKVNGELRQQSNTKKLLFTLDEIIAYVSSIMTLERGDIIATGTPEGVGQIRAGDRITAGIEQVGDLTVYVKVNSD